MNGTLSDLCDGSYYKNHIFFSTHRRALQILFYYDDVEMYNPLGSSRTKHKQGNVLYLLILLILIICTTGLFYFTLGNLHPKFRSKTANIHLVAICRNKYIKKYSINKVLDSIVKDVIKLVRTCNYIK